MKNSTILASVTRSRHCSRNSTLLSRRGMCINVRPFSISTIRAAVTTLEKWGASFRHSGQVRRKASSTAAAMS